MRKSIVLESVFLAIFGTMSCGGAQSPSLEPIKKSIPPTVAVKVSTSTENPNPFFDLSTVNKIPPEAILKEVTFFVGGGFASCPSTDSGPVIASSLEDAELMQPAVLKTCGWQEPQTLIGTVQYPNGKIITQTIDTYLGVDEFSGDTFLYADLYFKATFDDPEGLYIIQIEGKESRLQSKVYYLLPTVPRLYLNTLERKYLYLYKFSAYEKVALIYYDNNGKFAGWQDYKVGAYGNLIINTSIDKG